MKTEISRDSHQLEKRYSGVYQQQGRMLTDSDWNELVDILKDRLNDALKDVVGTKSGSEGGTPRHRALSIADDPADTFKIHPGHVYVNGVAARIPGDTDIAYENQPDFPSPPAPTGDYVLYADVWERTVTQLVDERLRDKGLHGADTCSRKQTIAQIKWCPYDTSTPDNIDNDPEKTSKNPTQGDAELSLTLLQKTTDPDPCDPCAAELDVESKVGNYLFRAEVHDVRGDANGASEITLKWSSENGAEQFEALPGKQEMPGGFISDKWIYEFYDETSERHLGVHLGSTTWEPARGIITEIKEPGSPYAVPPIPGSNETRTLVRRWDGYCKLNLTTKTLIEGVDRGVALSTSKAEGSLGYVNIGDSLDIVLASIELDLELAGKSFVAGDFWLADVREAEHDPLDPETSTLLDKETPRGIMHHYLTLGRVTGGALEDNPEADRKYAFPPLTEMTRMFHVGGDGQEAMPNHFVPQSLKVGVTNGEWPVAGAKVEFEVTEGGGKLEAHPDFALENFDPGNPVRGIATTDGASRNGWANCRWQLGPSDRKQRVTARLVDPDSHPLDADYPRYLDHPPIHFYANLSTADHVAYDNPACAGSPSMKLLLDEDTAIAWPDFDGDGDVTVKDVLDVLLCELEAAHVPYAEPSCVDTPSVKSLLSGLDFNGDGHLTVADVLDTLLCKLKAEHVPYDPAPKDARWGDINDSPDRPATVQEAIDDLAENLESTDIRYEVPACGDTASPTVRSSLGIAPGTTKIDQVLDKLLCEFNATDLPLDRNADLCDRLKSDVDVKTVQDAINALCEMERGGGCAVTVGKGGQFETLQEALERLIERNEVCICLLPGVYPVKSVPAVKDKTTIKITGCGALVSRIHIVDKLSLEASEIVLRDISFIGGDIGSTTTEGGGLLLSGKDSSHFVVENCHFSRVFRGSQDKWIPVVAVEGSVRLDWHGNEMTASRQDEKLSDAVLPDKAALSGASLDAYLELEAVWTANPYDSASGFDEKVASAAEKIAGLTSAMRTDFFDARSVGLIDGLPASAIDIGGSRMMLERASSPMIAAMETVQPVGTAAMSTRRVIDVSPKSEVAGLFEDIRTASAADVDKLIDRIKVIATLVTSIDDALSLADGQVGGGLSNNAIQGHVVLFGGQAEGTELDWGATDAEQQAIKKAWAAKTQFLNGTGVLSIHDNVMTAVHSVVSIKALDRMKEIFTGNEGPFDFRFEGYESLSVQGNTFTGLQSSFAAAKLRVSGNDLGADADGGVVGYAMGYSNLFVGNLASSSKAVIEQVSGRRQEAANLLIIV